MRLAKNQERPITFSGSIFMADGSNLPAVISEKQANLLPVEPRVHPQAKTKTPAAPKVPKPNWRKRESIIKRAVAVGVVGGLALAYSWHNNHIADEHHAYYDQQIKLTEKFIERVDQSAEDKGFQVNVSDSWGSISAGAKSLICDDKGDFMGGSDDNDCYDNGKQQALKDYIGDNTYTYLGGSYGNSGTPGNSFIDVNPIGLKVNVPNGTTACEAYIWISNVTATTLKTGEAPSYIMVDPNDNIANMKTLYNATDMYRMLGAHSCRSVDAQGFNSSIIS